jgi:hypothetical protein
MEPMIFENLVFVALGALFAFAYLGALDLNVRLYLGSGSGWFALLLHAGRLLVTVAALTLCSRMSGLCLVSGLVGFQIMRIVTLGRATIEITS